MVQKSDEIWREFVTRLNRAISRCGYGHSNGKVIGMYIDGLSSGVPPKLAYLQESRSRLTYMGIVDFAAVGGNTLRALGA